MNQGNEMDSETLRKAELVAREIMTLRARVAELEAALRLTLRAVELAGWEGDYAAIEARKALGLSGNKEGSRDA